MAVEGFPSQIPTTLTRNDGNGNISRKTFEKIQGEWAISRIVDVFI
jgi:hypothetical protein